MAGDTNSGTRAADTGLAGRLNPLAMATSQQLGLLAVVFLALLPLLVGLGVFLPGGSFLGITELLVLQLTGALFFAVYVMSWDVVSGYTGEISFGHALFFGVGGYASAMLNLHWSVPLVASIPLGVVAAAFAGFVIGYPSLRIHGPYFSLITLVAPIILLSLFRFRPDLTGGELGLFGIDTISLDPVTNYYVAFGVFLFALAVFLGVTRSDAGIVLTGIREDELAVQAAGLNPAKFKLFAFVLSGAVGGLAGALFVHSFAQGVANPGDLLVLVVSIEVIVAAILGGIGTITGAAVGGFVFYMLQVYIRGIDWKVPLVGQPIKEFDFLVFALVTLAFLFFLPEGIVPRLLRAGRRLSARLGWSDDPAADGGRTPLQQVVEKFVGELRDLIGGDRR